MASEVFRRLRLLGPVCVERVPVTHEINMQGGEEACSDREVPRFRSRRTMGLLGYLVAEKRPIARDYLSTLFWPDEPISKGRANLRRELHNLTQILPDCWELDPQAVTFVPPTEILIDIYTLEQLEEGERLEEAVELLGGEFLEGIYLEDNLTFENWLLRERERWGELSQTILTRFIQGNINRGRYAEALHYTQRQLQFAPWNESAHQGAMRLLAWMGRRGSALHQFETCKQALMEELHVEPTLETVDLYQQIQEGTLALPPQLPAFLTTEKARHEYEPPPFVGREDELEKLNAYFEKALDGKSQVVFISGSAGRGKTALLEAFSQRAMEMHPNLLVARGNCNAYIGAGDPYLPFRDVMMMITGDVEGRWDAGAITRDHAQRLWAAFLMVVEVLLEEGPHLLDVFIPAEGLLSRCVMAGEDQIPWITQLKGLVHLNRAGRKEVEQSHLYQQVTDVLTHVANNQPLLLILDDLQWGDTPSISLLFHLGRRLAETESQLMIVCAYRPEEVSISRKGERHPLVTILAEFKRTYGDIWVDLGRLDKRADREFVDALVDIEPNRLNNEWRTSLFDRTGGHPLFTLELLRTMQGRGELVRDADGVWISGPNLDWDILPARVEAVIGERINRLDPNLQDILAVASVEGEVFTAEVVAEVQNVPVRTILRWLSHDLEHQHRLVIEQEEVDTGKGWVSRYKFSHILFQDYLYRHLGQGERRLLHGAVATAQETLYTGQLEEMSVGLANHYYLAQDHERAFYYFLLAGDRAAHLYESGEAIKHYTTAINLSDLCAPEFSSLVRLHRGRGLAFDRTGEFEKAHADYATTLELAGSVNDQVIKWRANLDLGKLWTSRDYGRAKTYYKTALELSREMDDPGLLANSLNRMGNWYANNENPKAAVEHHLEALKICEDQGDKQNLANSLDLLALASILNGNLSQSVRYYDRAIPLYRNLGDRLRLASSLIGRASTVVALVYKGSVDAVPFMGAMSDVNEALQIAVEFGLASEETWGYYSSGLLNLLQGRFGRSLEDISNGLRIATGVGHREYEVGNRFALGTVYAELFAADLARLQLEEALNLARELRSQTWIHVLSGALASVFFLDNDWEAAQSCLDSAISADTPMDTLGQRACWVRKAELALASGDPVLALGIIESLITSIPSVSPENLVTYLWMLKGKGLAALGRTEAAEEAFIAAIDNIETTGERYLLWRIHGDLCRLYQAMGLYEAAEAEMSLARAQVEELAPSIPDVALAEGFRRGAFKALDLNCKKW